MSSTEKSAESSTESSSVSPSDGPPEQTAANDRLEPAPSTFEQCIRQAQVGDAHLGAFGDLIKIF